MASIFSRPKTPNVATPDALPPPAERSDSDTQAAAETQRAAFFLRGGRASTMLTGGQGTSGASAAVRFLGGAART